MFTQYYIQFIGLALTGVAGIIAVMQYMNYRKLAQSGNYRKMGIATLAPAIMLILSAVVTAYAFSYVVPIYNNIVNSPQVQAGVQAGGVVTNALDNLFQAPVNPVQIPNIETPNVNVPNVEMPNVEVPNVEVESQSDRRLESGFVTTTKNEAATGGVWTVEGINAIRNQMQPKVVPTAASTVAPVVHTVPTQKEVAATTAARWNIVLAPTPTVVYNVPTQAEAQATDSAGWNVSFGQ